MSGGEITLCEIDPIYCDRIIWRWEVFAKDEAELITRGDAEPAIATEGVLT